jgi:hypothetical protein
MTNQSTVAIRRADGTDGTIKLDMSKAISRQIAFDIEKKQAVKSKPSLKFFYESVVAQPSKLNF